MSIPCHTHMPYWNRPGVGEHSSTHLTAVGAPLPEGGSQMTVVWMSIV